MYLYLQTRQQLEGMRGGNQPHMDRMHARDRGRPQIGPLRSRPLEKSRVIMIICVLPLP